MRGKEPQGQVDISADVKSRFKLLKNKQDGHAREMAKKNNLFCQKILSTKERNNLNNIQAIMIRDQEKQQLIG